jgi:hypothetical protein
MASQDEEMIDKLLAEEDIENAFDKLEIDLNLAIKEKEEAIEQLYESARQMKTFGMPTEIISKATNLSIDEIESL